MIRKYRTCGYTKQGGADVGGPAAIERAQAETVCNKGPLRGKDPIQCREERGEQRSGEGRRRKKQEDQIREPLAMVGELAVQCSDMRL